MTENKQKLIIEIPQIERQSFIRLEKNEVRGAAAKRKFILAAQWPIIPTGFYFRNHGHFEGDDTLPDGSNPFIHLSFHTLLRSQYLMGVR